MNDEVSEFMIAGIVGLAGWFFGGLDGYIKVLIACTVIDYVTGICRAGIERKISSGVAFKGIARKITMFMLVGVANILLTFIYSTLNRLSGLLLFCFTSAMRE